MTETDEAATSTVAGPESNPAVEHCMREWRRVYAEATDDDAEEYLTDNEAEKKANGAYLRALPPLSGYGNVCDFIACVANASATGLIRPQEAEHLLAAVKIAMGVLRFEPKPAGSAPRRPGRPRKTAPTEEK
jgi:hypothetical protein